MKKLILFFLTAAVFLTNAVFPAYANLIGEDGFYYSLIDSNYAALENYRSDQAVVQVPSAIYSHEVCKISDYAFLRNQTITEVTLPDTIKTIGSSAFNGCSKLEKIIIPDSVAEIGKSAFANCNKLVIYCNSNSFAETYAINNNINYQHIGTSESAIIGDVDGDKDISSYDSLLVLRYSVDLENFTEQQKILGNVDEDGSIDSFDSLVILRYSVGMDVSEYKIGQFI